MPASSSPASFPSGFFLPDAEARLLLSGRGPDVAPFLLGALLTTASPEGAVVVRITEVEAYQGHEDPGSHAFRGPSARNATMFGEAGHLYAYRHLGLHTCVNVVCGPVGEAAAVLLRAGEVVSGHDAARRRRAERGVTRRDTDLAQGPARLTVALGLGPQVDGVDLLDPLGEVRMHMRGEPAASGMISRGPRVGVSGVGGDGLTFPWRMWLTGEPTVSAYRAATTRSKRTVPLST